MNQNPSSLSEQCFCPLCGEKESVAFYEDKKRHYFRCRICDLVYVPSQYHLSLEIEKAVYDQHQNDPADKGYRTFLGRLADPLIKQLAPNSKGLDFGSGPGPTLSVMMEEAGFQCNIYDPLYADDSTRLVVGHYDFVTATEVVEHVSNPEKTFELLFSLLKLKNSVLAIMTKRATTLEAFKTWHYIHDPTHICFYSERTFLWIEKRYSLNVSFPEKDVVFFQRGSSFSKV